MKRKRFSNASNAKDERERIFPIPRSPPLSHSCMNCQGRKGEGGVGDRFDKLLRGRLGRGGWEARLV